LNYNDNDDASFDRGRRHISFGLDNNTTAANKDVQVVAATIKVQPQTLESTTSKSETIPPTEDVEVGELVGRENISVNDITDDATTIQ
jgi:hypothetical protein